MKKIYILAALFTSYGFVANAQFQGELVLEPEGCRQTSQCILGANFGYIDSYGLGWEADAGNVTDGASIPRWAQFFAGVPFEESYLPAAILHDHYSRSGRPVRGWFQTQRMFHEVLLVSGVSEERAAVLFAGVLIGSRKWIEVADGRPCPTIRGVACINAEEPDQLSMRLQEPTFGSEEYRRTLDQLVTRIENEGITNPILITEIARELMPNDDYLIHTGGVLGGPQEF